jgi:hypothetical protein
MTNLNKARQETLAKHSPVRMVTPPSPAELLALDRALMDEKGRVRVLPASDLESLDPDTLRFWLHVRSVYMLPSKELVEWLDGKIGGRTALEIASGNGVLGRALGIPRTDNHMQDRPEIRAHLALMGQPPVAYGEDVERQDANAAVRLRKPEVVVAAWATHIYRENDHARGGNMWGIDERKIVSLADYIHVGSKAVHHKKRIMSLPHEEHELPGMIFGRGAPEDRRAWIWRKQ